MLKGEENEVKHHYEMYFNCFNSLVYFQLRKKIIEKSKDGSLKVVNGDAKSAPKKRGRWDQTVDEIVVPAKKRTLSISTPSTAATPVWEGDVSQ